MEFQDRGMASFFARRRGVGGRNQLIAVIADLRYVFYLILLYIKNHRVCITTRKRLDLVSNIFAAERRHLTAESKPLSDLIDEKIPGQATGGLNVVRRPK